MDTNKKFLSEKQKRSLLNVARKTIEQTVARRPLSDFESDDPLFAQKLGCFVTLHNHGDLRGCIGQFQPRQPLLQTVREMAVAATRDSRFRAYPITPDELKDIVIESSVLAPLEKTDAPLSLTLGTHGIYIKKGWASGCFLPQVAAETGWNKEEFLSYCCQHKAGLPPDAWKSKDTEVFLFTAEVFGEKDFPA